jgi:L-lactate dehydrogenase (cytochrome)
MPDLSRYLTVEDFRLAARRRVPKMFFEYADHGGFTEQTYRENQADFDEIKLRQRIAVDMSDRSIATTILGQPSRLPVIIAPIGLLGMQSADGEIKAARAAHKAGIPFCLSMMSICSVEDIAENVGQPFWAQVYFTRDKEFMARFIQRCRAAGVTTLVLTMDRQVQGERHNERRNGLSAPPKFTARSVFNMAIRPAWAMRMLGTRRHNFRNIMGHAKGTETLKRLSGWGEDQFDVPQPWDYVDWIRTQWDGPIIIKGLNDAEDARLAVEHGMQGMVVSNHGGRQLDGAASTIRVLPEVVDAVNGKAEIFIDSGIRSGQSLLKAIALGAKAAMLGRSTAYALGAEGEAGVVRMTEIIAKELDVTMALCGERDVKNLGPHNIYSNDLLQRQGY